MAVLVGAGAGALIVVFPLYFNSFIWPLAHFDPNSLNKCAIKEHLWSLMSKLMVKGREETPRNAVEINVWFSGFLVSAFACVCVCVSELNVCTCLILRGHAWLVSGCSECTDSVTMGNPPVFIFVFVWPAACRLTCFLIDVKFCGNHSVGRVLSWSEKHNNEPSRKVM